MRKILFLVLVLSVFTANVFARGEVRLWGGYTAVAMEDLNNSLDSNDIKSNDTYATKKANKLLGMLKNNPSHHDDKYFVERLFKENGLESYCPHIDMIYKEGFTVQNLDNNITTKFDTLKTNKINDAFIVGVDYLFDIDENVKVGPRVAFLRSTKGTIEIDTTTEVPISISATELTNLSISGKLKQDIDISLVPIMVGGSYSQNVSEKFSLNGNLFLGYGTVKFKLDTSEMSVTTSIGERELRTAKSNVGTLDKNTGCFVSDISIGAQYLFTKRFGLGFDLGYRFTPVTKIPDSDIKIDFSGLTTTLNLNYKI